MVRWRVQPQSWSDQTRGHQHLLGLEHRQEQEMEENILSGGQLLAPPHLQEQLEFWKVERPGQESGVAPSWH